MKTPTINLLSIGSLACAFLAVNASARPIDFQEVSLLVRAHENQFEIVQEVSQRKLMRALTPAEETKLRSQGAGDPLIQALRNSSVILPAQEAAALEQDRVQRAKMPAPASKIADAGNTANGSDPQFTIFDVSFGHPVNLSEWGGPDYEFAFQCRRFAGEDIVEPFLTSPSRNYIDTATYLGAGRREDRTTVFDDR
ncbi:MAG: hypothetical protein M3Y03_05945, partial [Verrucomicrobiota bacterium]|nr:hypothetical protein [Verrucomicrobiota bacterium]